MAYKGSSSEKADKRYRAKVQEDDELRKKRNLQSTFRGAKSFIRLHATLENLDAFDSVIAERRRQLKEEAAKNNHG